MHVKNEIHRKYHITQELERAIKKEVSKDTNLPGFRP